MLSDEHLPVLSIETSGELCSVAVYRDEKTYSEVNILKKHINSQKLFSAIDQAIGNFDITRGDIKAIAVSIGPGSFTGLRIGLAAAKGIADGLNVPIISVPTFEAFAGWLWNINQEHKHFAIVNKVNSTELFIQKFEFNGYIDCKPGNLEIILQNELENLDNKYHVFGNFTHPKVKSIDSVPASAIAKWAYFFGQDLVTFDYNYLEPNYVKSFIVKVNK